jgi:hypothetical protein
MPLLVLSGVNATLLLLRDIEFGCTPRRMKTVPSPRSTSSQVIPRISERRAPVTTASRMGISQRVSRETWRSATSCAVVGQCSARRRILGRLIEATGMEAMRPSSTAWRRAEPRMPRAWAMEAAARPRCCMRVRTARMWPGLTFAISRPPMAGTISRRMYPSYPSCS